MPQTDAHVTVPTASEQLLDTLWGCPYENEIVEILPKKVDIPDGLGILVVSLLKDMSQEHERDEILQLQLVPTPSLLTQGILALELEVNHPRVSIQHDIPL
jgi:hypothetical protein